LPQGFVQQDWRAFLPEAPASLFAVHTKELENSYVMFSLSLNEAMNLHLKGESEKACPKLEMVEGSSAVIFWNYPQSIAIGTN
jgi:hypothetical protein